MQNFIKACFDEGIWDFNFINRGDFATLVFAEIKKLAKAECPEMIMGSQMIQNEALVNGNYSFIIKKCSETLNSKKYTSKRIPE